MVLPSMKYLVLVTKLNFIYRIILKYNPTHINFSTINMSRKVANCLNYKCEYINDVCINKV